MHHGTTPPVASKARRGTWRLLAVVVSAFALLALSAAGASAMKTRAVWLCKGKASDPCEASLTTTVTHANGSTEMEDAKHARKPPIDCFYVYPTVSSQANTNGKGELIANATLAIEPEETQIAIDQASRFSQQCRVFAPMYEQITIPALNTPGAVTLADQAKAFSGVRMAWEEYMAKYNKGRGVVLIGHSQGSFQLTALLQRVIEPNPAEFSKIVAAILPGGQELVPEGHNVGGTFQKLPTCEQAAETHCLIGYSDFYHEPPEVSNFGRPSSPLTGSAPPGLEVVCVNPTLLAQNGGSGAMLPYASTTPFPGDLGPFVETPTGSTPWVSAPGLYTAQCHKENGASWLQVNPVGTPGDERPLVHETLGPEWGLHLVDMTLPLGNLVRTVGLEAQTYLFEQEQG